MGNGTSASVTLLSSITEGEISLLIVMRYDIIAIILLAPQRIESSDLEDVVTMDNLIYYIIVSILHSCEISYVASYNKITSLDHTCI